ncbi:MAG TPA: DUF2894 domain-containing protein [Polyangiaceae bacterium]
MSATLARGELEALRALGGDSFDPPAFGFAAKLLEKGESLGGAAGARLLDRARARMAGLRTEIEGAHARLGGAGTGDLRNRLREARKRARLGRAEGEGQAAAEWKDRLLARARERQVRVDPHAPITELVEALYVASRREVTAMHAAMQAAAEVPEWTGPYNAAAIAARTLAELAGLSPGYLATLVAHLGELAPLLTLPPLPSTTQARKPPGRSLRPRGPRS